MADAAQLVASSEATPEVTPTAVVAEPTTVAEHGVGEADAAANVDEQAISSETAEDPPSRIGGPPGLTEEGDTEVHQAPAEQSVEHVAAAEDPTKHEAQHHTQVDDVVLEKEFSGDALGGNDSNTQNLSEEGKRAHLQFHTVAARQILAAHRRIALVSGAHVEARESGEDRRRTVDLDIQSDDPLRVQRAVKFAELFANAKQGWVAIGEESDPDLTTLTIPQSVYNFIYGKQGSNLDNVGDETNTAVWFINETEQVDPKPAVSWLSVGRCVAVKRSGDIRVQSWEKGVVKQLKDPRTALVKLDNVSESLTPLVAVHLDTNVRPWFEAEDSVEVQVDGQDEWVAASSVLNLESGQYQVKVGDEGTPQDVDISMIRLSAEEQAGPVHRLAIYGGLRERTGAKLRFMASVDKKTPAYYEGVKPDFGAADGSNWATDVVEVEQAFLPQCIGTKGTMKRKLIRASDCCLEYLATSAYIAGHPENRVFAAALLETLRSSERSILKSVPAKAAEYCESVVIPADIVALVMGAARSSLNKIEEEEGVVTFFQDDDGGAYNETELTEGTLKAHVEAEEAYGSCDAGQTGRKLLIFAFASRSRLLARHRVEAIVDNKLKGHFSGSTTAFLSDAEGVDTDILELGESQMGWASGKHGSSRRKIQAASGCGVAYVGHFAYFIGTKDERRRAQDYLQWLLEQLDSPTKDRHLRISSAELAKRSDVSTIELTSAEVQMLDSKALQAIEENTGNVLVFHELPDSELFSVGAVVQVQRGGRTVSAEIVTAESGDALTLSLRICDAQPKGEEEVDGTVSLLIFGQDAGETGFSGRALAIQQIREALTDGGWGAAADVKDADAGGEAAQLYPGEA
eukprot:CAMPEP_0194512576 /NCGR_PEP_ID=MMETSP0253-20130528/44601_1 /TAXON_ID=2966 /ORGANISM="Noctiluca scintillans" /LENGTH=856 /DNA_ID=CAMNT_0039356045 /DNA_START=37 /DNA_END=2603 /DNA_ORIENTATION=+